MPHITSATLAVALGVTGATGTTGVFEAQPAAAAPATGWVVENPRTDDLFDTLAGSATIVDTTTGATISCATVSGLGKAESGTIRPDDWFGSTIVTQYASCTGPGAAELEVFSPEIRLVPTSYDAAGDSVTGFAIVDIWGLFLDAPDCGLSLYPTDPLAEVPMAYGNGSATIDVGEVTTVVDEATGDGCGALPALGDEVTFATTLVASPGFTVRPA